MHFCPWVYIDFYVKMPVEGCSTPNTCAFIQIPGTKTGECEGHTDKLFPVRKSLGEWVGIDSKQMKKAKHVQHFFQIGVRIPLGLNCFCQISPEWVSIMLQILLFVKQTLSESPALLTGRGGGSLGIHIDQCIRHSHDARSIFIPCFTLWPVWRRFMISEKLTLFLFKGDKNNMSIRNARFL